MDTIATLRHEIDELRSQIKCLNEKVEPRTSAIIPTPRLPMWALIRDYLLTVGGQATPINIANGLLKAGHDLGKYSLRNVKITVTSPQLSGVFRIKKDATGYETVILSNHVVKFTPKDWPPKRAIEKK